MSRPRGGIDTSPRQNFIWQRARRVSGVYRLRRSSAYTVTYSRERVPPAFRIILESAIVDIASHQPIFDFFSTFLSS